MRTIVYILFPALTAIPCLQAQEAEGGSVPLRGLNSTAPITPAPASAFQSILPAAFLRAAQGEEDVSLKTGFRFLGYDAVLTAKAALNEEGPTELANVGGLSSGTTVSLGWQGVLFEDTASTAEIIAWCRALDPPASRDIDCDDPDTYGTNSFSDEVAATFPADRYYLWNITGELGHSRMKFLQAGTYDPGQEDRYAGSIGLNFGTIYRGLLLGVGARYEGSWEEGENAEICVPLGTGGALQCRNGPLGAPEFEREAVINGQARRFIGSKFGIHAQADYRPGNGEWRAQVPLYFAPDGDGGLIGGISPAYNFKSKEFSLSLFIGTALSFSL